MVISECTFYVFGIQQPLRNITHFIIGAAATQVTASVVRNLKGCGNVYMMQSETRPETNLAKVSAPQNESATSILYRLM